MTGTGLASVSININDNIQPSFGTPSGVCAVLGYTQRGEVGKPTLISTVAQFNQLFGNIVTDGDFAHLCTLALEAGAKLLVSRLVKFDVASGLWTPTGVVASSAIASCKWQGIDGNNISITIQDAVSGLADMKDVFVSLDGISESLRDVPTTLSGSDIAALNARFTHVVFLSSLTTLANGVTTLTGGTNPIAPLVADYVGDKASATGVYSFDGSNGFDYIAAFGIAQNTVDVALSNYVSERGDSLAILHTPTGLLGADIVKYRKAVVPYAGVVVNNWRARMTTGGVKVASKLNASVLVEVNESPMYAAALCRKNATGQVWKSVAAPMYSYIDRVFGVVQNFLGTGRKAEADEVVNSGVVPIVAESNGKVRIFGDATMQLERGFLQNANIADTVSYITNGVREIYNKYLFEPNDIPTWRQMHVEVMNFLKPIQDGGGIRAYRYDGDQDANSFSSLTVNNVSDINDGIYKVRIYVFPTSIMKHIEISINMTSNLSTTVSITA